MSEADNAPMNRIPSPGHPTATNSSANRKAQKPTNKWLALVVTALGTLLAGLTASSINVALPVMAADEFGVGQSDIQWVVTVFLIVISSTMLLLGSIGDRIGSHKIYNSGLIVFTLGSLFCGLVGSLSASMGLSSGLGLGLLLVGRVIQGIGAAMTMATGMALVTTIFPPEQRGMALGFSVLVVGLGNVGGPAIGGMVLAFSTWPMIFYLNIPLAMVALVLGLAKLRSPMPPQKNAPRLDIMGAFILLITLAALITGIDGQFPYARWFLAPAIILIPVLILAERRHPSPLLNFQLLGNRRFSFGNLVTFFSYSSNMLLVFQLSFFLQHCWYFSPVYAGLLIMVSALFMGASAPLAGIIADRVGAMRVMPIAIGVLMGGQLLALFLTAQPNVALFIIAMAMTGTGMGFLNTPNNSEIMASAGRKFAGYASGFVGTNRNLAFTLAAGASAALFPWISSMLDSSGALYPPPNEYVIVFRWIIAVSLLLSTASMVLCLYLRHKNDAWNKMSVPANTESSTLTEKNEARGK